MSDGNTLYISSNSPYYYWSPKTLTISGVDKSISAKDDSMSIDQGKQLRIADHFLGIIRELGLNETDPNLRDTPNRYAKALLELCRGLQDTEGQIADIMKIAFPTDYDEMVAVRGIESVGICPHHFLPVLYDAVVAYIPSVTGKVVGLSKLPRIVEVLSARPILQEDLAVSIADTLTKYLNPLGVGVMLVGKHGCMQCRGVRLRGSDTVTTKLTGCFKEEPKVKEEFMAYCRPVLELGN